MVRTSWTKSLGRYCTSVLNGRGKGRRWGCVVVSPSRSLDLFDWILVDWTPFLGHLSGKSIHPWLDEAMLPTTRMRIPSALWSLPNLHLFIAEGPYINHNMYICIHNYTVYIYVYIYIYLYTVYIDTVYIYIHIEILYTIYIYI